MKTSSALVLSIVTTMLAACGGGGSSSSPTTSTAVPATAPTPIAVQATSYLNAKAAGNGPVVLPGYTLAFALADFKRDGTEQLFSTTINYDPSTSTPTTAAPSTFAFYVKDSSGAWVRDDTMIDTNVGCIHPRKAVVADLNGDGKPDIVVACTGYDAAPFPGEKMMVLLSTPSGKYHVTTVGDYVGYYHSASLGDIDRDGKIDIVVTDNMNPLNSIRVFKGNGDGTFVEHTELAPQNYQYAQLFSIELIDLNGDGKLDIITGGNDYKGFPVQSIMNTGASFNTGSVTILGTDMTYGVALDFLVDGSTLYIDRVTPDYKGSSIQAIDLTTHASSTLRSSASTAWTPDIVKFNGNVVSEVVGEGV